MLATRIVNSVFKVRQSAIKSVSDLSRGVKTLVIAEHSAGVLTPGICGLQSSVVYLREKTPDECKSFKRFRS